MWSICVLLSVLFLFGSRGSTDSPRVTTPDSFQYVFNDEIMKLIKVEDEPVRELKDITTGVYSLKLAGGRAGCGIRGGAEEYLGFNNRTCTSSLVPTKTAGPVMRGPSPSMLWREWMVVVKNREDDRVDVSLQAFVHPALEDRGKCLGYVSNYYGNPEVKGSCVIPPYGNGLFLNATSDEIGTGSQSWRVEMSSATESDAGVFCLVASSKPSVCLRQLGLIDCGSSAVLIGETSKSLQETSTYTTWNLVRRYDLVPVASPPPPPSHPPPPPPASPPPPPAPIPGPTIKPYVYGQTVVTSGFIEIAVGTFGGNDQCAVESIVFTSVAMMSGASTSTPAYRVDILRTLPATVPLMAGSEYEVYAQGACSSGTTTEQSNVLTVQSVMHSAPSSATPPTISSATWDSTTNEMSVTWTPGKNSVPPARDPAFFVTCFSAGTCPSSPAYDVNRPSDTITTIISLAPGPFFDCYVVAKNYNGTGVCSQKTSVSTFCFPGDSIVMTPTGKKFISHLEVGDKVLTVSRTGMVVFEEVYLLGHKDFLSVGLFLQIHTDKNATLRLTRDHQLPFASRVDKAAKYGPAAGVKVGDYVGVVSDGSTAVSWSKVTAVEEIFAQGYFNPYTMGGNIVVDGVVASCHSSFVLDKLFNRVGISIPAGYQAVFGPLRVMFKAVGAKSFQNIQFLVDAIVEIVNHPHLHWTQIIWQRSKLQWEWLRYGRLPLYNRADNTARSCVDAAPAVIMARSSRGLVESH